MKEASHIRRSGRFHFAATRESSRTRVRLPMLCARCAQHHMNLDRSDGERARPAYRTPAAMERSKAEVANLLSLAAVAAFGVVSLAAWSVLGDSAFAVKFE